MGRYVEYMLIGQTHLENVQNDRYPDIKPQTLDELQPVAPATQQRRATRPTCPRTPPTIRS